MSISALWRYSYHMDISSRRAQMNMQYTPPLMNASTQKAELQVSHDSPSFEVTNKDEINSDMGLTPPIHLTKEFAAKSRQEGLQAIGSIAQDYDFLMHIDSPGNTIANMAKGRMKREMPETNIGLMPKQGAKLKWHTGGVNIAFDVPKFNIDWQIQKPDISWQPHRIDIQWHKKPLPAYQTRGNLLDTSI